MVDVIDNGKPVIAPQRWFLRVGQLLLLGVLAVIGYQLAPPPLAFGAYQAQITAVIQGKPMTITFPFTIAEANGPSKTVVVTQGDLTLVVSGDERYSRQQGERITYRMRALDAAGQPLPLDLSAVTSTLSAPGYRQPLPPTAVVQADGATWLLFTMRMPINAQIVLALLFVVAGLWLTELVPLAATALLIPIVAVVAGVGGATTVLAAFADPIIMLFLAGFLMAEGMRRTGIDRWVALQILQHASVQPAYLMLTMMGLTAFLSMWMSNTASVAIMMPIALAILSKIPDEQEPSGFRKALILAIAYAATLGGIGSAIGTPANMLAMTYLNQYTAAGLAFVDWFAYGVPLVLLLLPLSWLYLLFSFHLRPQQVAVPIQRDHYAQELATLGPLTQPQTLILVIFCGVMALWLTEEWHGIDTAIVALGGAFLLFLLRMIQQEDLQRINWNALLTFGGGLTIGTLLVNTGVSDWVALQLIGLSILPAVVVIFLVASLTLLIGAFISNTACAAMLIPLAIPLAQLLGLDPRLLVVVVAIASSLDFALVVGTPPTMMAYATGFFHTSEIFRRGIIIDLLGVLLLSFVVVWIWWLWGAVVL